MIKDIRCIIIRPHVSDKGDHVYFARKEKPGRIEISVAKQYFIKWSYLILRFQAIQMDTPKSFSIKFSLQLSFFFFWKLLRR